jgi:hypothetical protein
MVGMLNAEVETHGCDSMGVVMVATSNGEQLP